MLVVDMVGGMETDKSGKKAPAAEKPSSERGNLSCGGRTVERAPGKMSRFVALDGVEDGKRNDLPISSASSQWQ